MANNYEIINDSIFFKPINSEEIMVHLNKIKNYNSFYEKNLSNYVLKNTSKFIYLPLSIIFNKYLLTGVYPINFKKCVVIPIFKAGDKLACRNYRPISISITLSTIFEKCIKSRLLDFLNKTYFFSKQQFGLRSGLSTIDAV